MRSFGRCFKDQSHPRFLSLIFTFIWLIAMGSNMYLGIKQGHSIAGEFGYFSLNFGIPCLIAFYFLYTTDSKD